jgi:hypothetical protein
MRLRPDEILSRTETATKLAVPVAALPVVSREICLVHVGKKCSITPTLFTVFSRRSVSMFPDWSIDQRLAGEKSLGANLYPLLTNGESN